MGGDLVYVRDFHCPNKWIPGRIVSVTGPLSYTVKIESGVVRRHIDHLRARHNAQVDSSEDVYMDSPNDVTSVLRFPQVLLRMELFLPLIHLRLGHEFKLLLNYLSPFHNFCRLQQWEILPMEFLAPGPWGDCRRQESTPAPSTDRHTPVASVHQSEEASRVLWTLMKQILCVFFFVLHVDGREGEM